MTKNRKIWHWLVLASLSLIWGTSYILMKKGLESFSSLQVGALRIVITVISPVVIIYLLFSVFSSETATLHWVRNPGFIAILQVFILSINLAYLKGKLKLNE